MRAVKMMKQHQRRNNMFTVVKLEPKGNRWHVYLENDIDFLLYKGEVRKFQIQEGICLNESTYKEITEILYKRARERALYILDRAYKTEKQITDKLKSGYYPAFVIDRVIQYLSEYDLINDHRYAAMYIDYKSSSRSRRQIFQDLYTKGVPKSIIDTALEEAEFADDASLKKMMEKRISRYDLKDRKDVEKLYRYFIGKGYVYSDVKKVLSEYFDEYNMFDD